MSAFAASEACRGARACAACSAFEARAPHVQPLPRIQAAIRASIESSTREEAIRAHHEATSGDGPACARGTGGDDSHRAAGAAARHEVIDLDESPREKSGGSSRGSLFATELAMAVRRSWAHRHVTCA